MSLRGRAPIITNFGDIELQPGEYMLARSSRGVPRLVYRGYTYMFDRTKSLGNIGYWRCTLSRTCFARAHMCENRNVKLGKMGHNHGPQLRSPSHRPLLPLPSLETFITPIN